MNGDEDLGEDIIMKGKPFHYSPDEETGEFVRVDLVKTQMCAHTPGEDACRGDSGGPLLIDVDPTTTAHEYVLAGVVSYGDNCGATPGVYTFVTPYKQWIQSVFPGAPFMKTKDCDRNDYEEGGGRNAMISELLWRQEMIAALSEEANNIAEQLFA